MTPQIVLDTLSDLNPDAIFFENMDNALVSVGRVGAADPVAVYSQAGILGQLQQDGFSEKEAHDYFFDKIVGAPFDMNAPVVLQDISIKD
jgi:hypothetical protein